MRSLSARLVVRFVLLSLVVAAVIVGAVIQFSAEQVMHLLMEGVDSAAEARAMFDQYVVQVLLIGAVAGILLGALAAWWLVRRLMRPLEELTRASQSIARGDLGARVPEPPDPELRRLAGSFNRMAASLERTEVRRRALVEDVAHELRTPLTSLRGYTEALADQVAEPTPEMLRTVHEEIERLTRLVEGLDQLARDEAVNEHPPRADLDLKAMVRRAMELATPELGQRRIEVSFDEPITLPPMRGNVDAIGQVLTNLIQNAARYTEDGGRITIHLVPEGDAVRCTIENTGDEIPPGELPLIWERLHRVDRSRARSSGGAGIGLAIVHEIVEAHDGTVGATSAEGRTAIWFTLPVASHAT